MKHILLFALAIFFVHNIIAQTYNISGKVIDNKSRQPLPFVNIVINDGQRGGTTDIDGKFSFRSNEKINLLSLSYVGYDSQKYTVGEKSQGITIRLVKKEYQLPEYVVFPTENPAHRIIENAIDNRDKNDPEKIPAFTYTNYDKMIFTFELDSLPMIDTLEIDTADESIREFLEDHHLFMMETVSERKFMAPNHNMEDVIATKIAGFKDPIFVFLLSQMQSTTFYNERISISDKNYINPISTGSPRKYFFLIQDTLYSGENDSVFVISYRPRINTNFDGLKGVISINSNNWAIQNVIAEPAGKESGISLRIEQLYEFIEDKQWFPTQLNTEVIMNNIIINDSAIWIGTDPRSDSTGNMQTRSLTFGKGKSYIKDIDLNPELRKRDFGNIEVEVDPNASHRKQEFWDDYRIDTLTQQEQNTYHFIDSIGREENFDRMAKTFESLMTGKIPWGYVDLDIHRFLKYNSYEGLALGVGLHTNDRLSQTFKVGGFVRYGFKDKGFKYGGDLGVLIHRNSELGLNLEYMKDVTETSGVTFFDEEPRLTNPEFFRDFHVRRMDKTELYKASVGFLTMKYLKVNLGLNKSNKLVTDDYRYGISEESVTVYLDQFDFTEVSLGFRYAYGEKFIKNMRKKISLGTDFPIFWFQYTKGISGFLNGDFDYNRYDFKIEKSFYTKYFGETSLKLVGGYIDADIPYTNLYNGNASYRPFTIFAPNSFATMRMNEFLSSKYMALYISHNFGKLLFQRDRFKPEFVIATNIAFGKLDYTESHYNVGYETLEKGYYESGILVNKLLDLKIYSLGLGAFYRYGPYGFDYGWDNLGAKFTMTFSF